jgi:hypothetical protein
MLQNDREMANTPQRDYLEDVPRELQDLIYDRQAGQATNYVMKLTGSGRMEAMTEVGKILSRMQERFPDAAGAAQMRWKPGVTARQKAILGWAFLTILTVTGATMTFFGGWGLLRANASKGWPTAKGRVLEPAVEESSTTDTKGRSSSSYHIRMLYEFTVDGTDFTGKRVAYGDKIGRETSRYASDVTRRYPAGKRVTVYYKPGNPKVSLLEPGVKGQTFIVPSIGLFLFLIGAFFVFVAIAVIQDERKAARKGEGSHDCGSGLPHRAGRVDQLTVLKGNSHDRTSCKNERVS